MKLSLGVIVVPEPEEGDTYTTAVKLENNYSLFTSFANLNADKIAKEIEESAAGSLETIMQGGVSKDPYAAATSQIDQDFRDFLSNKDIEKLNIAGVPTKAALAGKSLRFKNRGTAVNYVKGKRYGTKIVYGPRRPSFIYSGVLQASFRSWVE